MYGMIGVMVGLLLRYLIIEPIRRKRIREECVRDGLVPDYLK